MAKGKLKDRSIGHPEMRVTCSHLAIGVAVCLVPTREPGNRGAGDPSMGRGGPTGRLSLGNECAKTGTRENVGCDKRD
jgi:hypothetical protein